MPLPPIVVIGLELIHLALRYGPGVVEVYANAKRHIEMWFKGGVITVEQQAQLLNWADAHQEATLRGEVPPELTVEPNL